MPADARVRCSPVDVRPRGLQARSAQSVGCSWPAAAAVPPPPIPLINDAHGSRPRPWLRLQPRPAKPVSAVTQQATHWNRADRKRRSPLRSHPTTVPHHASLPPPLPSLSVHSAFESARPARVQVPPRPIIDDARATSGARIPRCHIHYRCMSPDLAAVRTEARTDRMWLGEH